MILETCALRLFTCVGSAALDLCILTQVQLEPEKSTSDCPKRARRILLAVHFACCVTRTSSRRRVALLLRFFSFSSFFFEARIRAVSKENARKQNRKKSLYGDMISKNYVLWAIVAGTWSAFQKSSVLTCATSESLKMSSWDSWYWDIPGSWQNCGIPAWPTCLRCALENSDVFERWLSRLKHKMPCAQSIGWAVWGDCFREHLGDMKKCIVSFMCFHIFRRYALLTPRGSTRSTAQTRSNILPSHTCCIV